MQIIFRRETAIIVRQDGASHRRTFMSGEVVTVEIMHARYDEIIFKYIDGLGRVNTEAFAILL